MSDSLVPITGEILMNESEAPTLTVSPKTAVERMQELIDIAPLLATRYKTLRRICIQHIVNSPNDWAMWGSERQGYRPRMNDGAAIKLLSFAGVKQMEETTWKEMLTLSSGKQKYIVWHKARYISPFGGEYVAVGSCASDDPFVSSRYEYDAIEKRKVKIEIPHEDVAYDNVVKAARANCLVNGVSGVMGLKNVDEAELNEILGEGFTNNIEHVGMTDRKWEVTEAQRGALLKMGAVESQIDACKNRTDIDNLFNQLKTAKDVRREVRKEVSSGVSTDNSPASAATMKALQRMADEKSIPWSEVDNFRMICWQTPSTDPVSNLQAQHISRWLQNPIPPQEYAAKARAAAANQPKQTSLV